jgi:hypothetical protein
VTTAYESIRNLYKLFNQIKADLVKLTDSVAKTDRGGYVDEDQRLVITTLYRQLYSIRNLILAIDIEFTSGILETVVSGGSDENEGEDAETDIE